jgi:RNA polymerase sigma-70 factor (ECF subfamily)
MSARITRTTTQRVQGQGGPHATRGDLLPEKCLIQQLVDGSEDAFAQLYDRHAAFVFAQATRTSGNRWIAAEVVQETFLTLWNRVELFDPTRGELRAWLMAIARNRAVDRLRQAKRRDRATTFSAFGNCVDADASSADWPAALGMPVAAAGPEPAPEARLSREETRASIAAAVASLAPYERSVILLAYDRGLSQSEIAVRLGWPIGTVKTRTRRALRHLRERLERFDGDVRARGPRVSGEDRSVGAPPRSGVASAAPAPGLSSSRSQKGRPAPLRTSGADTTPLATRTA